MNSISTFYGKSWLCFHSLIGSKLYLVESTKLDRTKSGLISVGKDFFV